MDGIYLFTGHTQEYIIFYSWHELWLMPFTHVIILDLFSLYLAFVIHQRLHS